MSLLEHETLLYEGLIGTGGIGTGAFFLANGNHTLGREESRSGRFLAQRDYCKLHILCHYMKVLLGESFRVFPIGGVGDDEEGSRLLKEMAEVGLDLTHVRVLPDKRTLFSFCLLYPDGSGGNLTADDSASAAVNPMQIEAARETILRLGEKGICAALPEAPLEARVALLDLAAENGLFRAASFTSEEMPWVRESRVLEKIDFLAINVDEAGSFMDYDNRDMADEEIAEKGVEDLSSRFTKLKISITAGSKGSWSWDGNNLNYVPAIDVHVVNSGGAGDAYLAGILAGIAMGSPLKEAQKLATAVAGVSVTSPHTIHKTMKRSDIVRLM